MVHALSEDFFKRFTDGGELNTLIQVLKTHPQFTMFLRGTYAEIYFKGLRVVNINENGDCIVTKTTGEKANDKYKQYIKSQNNDKYVFNLPTMTKEQWYDFLNSIAKGIDEFKYEKSECLEKEIQQQIVFENNMTSNQTDYFIIDMEYDQNEKGRYDAIAWHWSRGHQTPKQLAFIEVKAGDKAVKGDHGLTDHLSDIVNQTKDKTYMKELYTNMQKVFEQLYELGLYKKTPGKETDNGNRPKFNFKDELPQSQMIFILANYYQKHKALTEELNKDLWKQNNNDLEVLFATSSFMGYGLHDNCMKTTTKFIEMINQETN